MIESFKLLSSTFYFPYACLVVMFYICIIFVHYSYNAVTRCVHHTTVLHCSNEFEECFHTRIKK